MITVIDYGMGNLHSVCNALDAVRATYQVSQDPSALAAADGLILPGVGAFRDCMRNLKQAGLIEAIKEQAHAGKPLLGICLGMQVLFEKGYEVEESEGLGLLQGEVVRMQDPDVKIPHIGWNRLEHAQADAIVRAEEQPFVYYVHSFYAQKFLPQDLIAYSVYGQMKIPGYVRHGNVLGMQYHPEKSGRDGLRMLARFAALCEGKEATR